MNKTKKQHEKIRASNPDKYFGSDLNKFIYNNCGKKMIVNNIDLIMLKHRPGKKSILRVIESKHTKERPLLRSQTSVLDALCSAFKHSNTQSGYFEFQLYVVNADQPYNQLDVFDWIDKKRFTVEGRKNVINWLEMND
ncbi:MAG: hypothetical protein GY928_25900 [Colwellia sp.]|nr:hypothetical protein [Colwellia sp.]